MFLEPAPDTARSPRSKPRSGSPAASGSRLLRALAAAPLAALLLAGLVAPAQPGAGGVEASAATSQGEQAPLVPLQRVALRTTKIAKITRYTTAPLNLRTAASASSTRLATLPKATKVTSTLKSSNGWFRVSYAGKTGWVSGAYLSAKNPVVDPYAACKYTGHTGTYTSTQNGASDAQRYYTQRASTVTMGCGTFTVPAGTPVWKVTNASNGRWRVNVGGSTKVLMRSADLGKTSPLPTTNTSGISLSAFKKLPAGAIARKYLARTSFGTQAVLGAPAVASLNELNKAYKARFGEDLYIDLGYRTKSQQQYFYKVLGAKVAAKPGTSVHERALSIDLPELAKFSWGSARFAWLKKNAPRFGWVHPARVAKYTSSGALNPYREYWHFDYVGTGK